MKYAGWVVWYQQFVFVSICACAVWMLTVHEKFPWDYALQTNSNTLCILFHHLTYAPSCLPKRIEQDVHVWQVLPGTADSGDAGGRGARPGHPAARAHGGACQQLPPASGGVPGGVH